MISQKDTEAIGIKYSVLRTEFDERARRMWAATEAKTLGHGGVVAVSKATGLAESTIRIGRKEIQNRSLIDKKQATARRVRQKGGGRKSLEQKDSELLVSLDKLVDPESRGDPMSPLRWTCKSTRRLAKELTVQGYVVSHTKVGQMLAALHYSLQSTRKRMEGKSHPDRDAQFKFINGRVIDFQSRGQPVISVDAKKRSS
jgi:hypothetical protein